MDTQTSANMKSGRVYLPVIALLVIGLMSAGAVYKMQHDKLIQSTQKSQQLTSQLSSLKQNLVTLQAKANVTTADWKTYCDPTAKYCFKYPGDWKIDQSSQRYDFGATISTATVTNPEKSLQISYNDYYIKDGGYVSSYIASVDSVGAKDLKVSAVCGYAISSVSYQPSCAAVNTDRVSDLHPSQVSLWINAVSFGGIQFVVSDTKGNLTTRDQANDWFSSIDGKTAELIIKSLNKQN